MAMNFWDAQQKAKSRTTLFVLIFLILTLAVAVGAEMSLRFFVPESYSPPIPYFGLAFAGITFLVALFEYSMYSSYGGAYVAESMGAMKINPATANAKERQILNIVEEIALAACLPIPPVYIIPAGQINAFAAGLTKESAAIAITKGSLNILNREELQGVIAHEFGHIHNGDMKISMRLAAMVMGFFFILYFALRLFQFSGMFDRDNREEKKGLNPILVAAIILLISGAITYIAGSLLKCAVSREREYLADACAVQFTRNPEGIANALRKIGVESVTNDMPKSGLAYSHLYLDNHSGIGALFATHPSLQKRIAAIEGREYIPAEWNIPSNS
jgi:heat shock protein HtpX